MKGALTAEHLRSIADQYLTASFANESAPQVRELAARAGFRRTDFTKVFASIVGESPSTYLRRGQITCAKELLANSTLSLNSIAYRCGFGTRTTFYRAFKRATGVTPKQYRATAQLH